MNVEKQIRIERQENSEKVVNDIEIIYERLKSGDTQAKIAKEYNVSESVISRRISDYCHYHKKDRIKKRPVCSILTKEDIQAIIKEYENEEAKIEDLAAKYNVSKSTIRWHLPEIRKTEQKKQEENTESKQDIVSNVIEMYESGESIQYIKDKLDLKSKDLRMILINYMDIKDGKLSKKSIEILQKLGYDIELIQKVAKDKNIEIKEQKLLQEDIQL